MDHLHTFRKLHTLGRFFLLAILVIVLLPGAPAIADDPSATTDESAGAAGEVSASDIALSETQAIMPDGVISHAVSISGDVMAVGAPYLDLGTNTQQGAVFLFGRNVGGPGQWGELARLTAGDGAKDDYFGWAVAMYSTTVVISAPDADVAGQEDQGAAYVFAPDAGGVWRQTKKLTAGQAFDHFGESVAIYESTIVVGAAETLVDGKDQQGVAYIFQGDVGGAGNWNFVKRLAASDGKAGDYFGIAAAVAGDWIVVGADSARVSRLNGAGAAYLFGKDAGGADDWGQVKKLVADDPAEDAYFGGAVGMSGTTVVVGAERAWVDGKSQGAAYVFERDQGGYQQWGLLKKLSAANGEPGDRFGAAVAISGAAIVVGAPDAYYVQKDAGMAFLFGRNTAGANQWGLLSQVVASNPVTDGFLGELAAIDNVTIAAGSETAEVVNMYAPFGMRVNSAGPKVTDVAGNLWLADRPWPTLGPGGVTWGYIGIGGRTTTQPIAGTEDDKLYQTERLWSGSVKPGYKFGVPNGRYMLTFKHAETYWNTAGKRKFTVMAEKKICFANYDPFVAAGGARYTAAPDQVCYVDVKDGLLEIDFISVVGQAKANAIYIQRLYQ